MIIVYIYGGAVFLCNTENKSRYKNGITQYF